MRIARRGLLLALALLASVLASLLLGGPSALGAVHDVPAEALVLVVGVTALGWCARAAKLWLISRRVGIGLRALHAFAISLATDLGFLATPGGFGGYAANVLLLRRAGATTSAATAVAAADQIVDALFFALALPVAALCALDSALPQVMLGAAVAGAGLMLAAASLAWWSRRPLARWLARVAGDPGRRPRMASLHDLLTRAAGETAAIVRDDRRVALALLALTTLQWTTRYGVLWLALAAFGHAVPYSVTLIAQGVVMHLAQWTGVPSGAGGAEFGLAAALAPWVDAGTLAPAVLVWRGATLYLPLLAGGIALLGLLRGGRASQARLAVAGRA